MRDAYSESRKAVSDYADSLDYTVRLIELELAAAELSLRADGAVSAQAFGDALKDELKALDLYLERLQARAATKIGSTRTDAEDAIRDLRSHRNAFALRVEEVRTASTTTWRDQKAGIAAERAELAEAIGETATKVD